MTARGQQGHPAAAMFQEWFNMPDSSAAKDDEKTDTNKPRRTDLSSALERKGIIATTVERNVKTATSSSVQRVTQNTRRLVESHTHSSGETVSSNTRQTLVGRTVEKSVRTTSRTVEKHSSSAAGAVMDGGARPTLTTSSSSKVEKHVSSSVKVEKTDASGVAVEESHRTQSTVKEKTKSGETDAKGEKVETMTRSVNRRDRLQQKTEMRPAAGHDGHKDGAAVVGKSLDLESRSEAKQSVVSKSVDGAKPDVSFTSTFKGEHGFREQVTSSPTAGRKAIEGAASADGSSVVTRHKHDRKQNDSEHGGETVTTRSGLFGITSMLTGFVSGATNKAWCVVQNAYEMAYDYYSGSGQWFDWESASDDEGSDEESEEDTTKSAEKTQAKKLRLYNICNELMTTERDYVRKLEILVTAKNKTVRILQPDVAKAMFKDVEVIYQFHHDTLLPELQKRLTSWDKDDRIGDIMKKLAPFLKLSTEYVKQFEAALTLVETWQKKSSSFAALLREIAENPDYGRLHLNAHMMEPVQRIPRYGLLLRDYVKHLPKDSPDKPDAEKALELVEDAALHFEHMMKRDSVIGQLLKVQRQLDSRFGIVSPSRELIMEGKMMKVSIKNGKPTERYAFLFNDLLLVCSEHVLHVGKRYKVRDVVGLAEIQMSESENKDVPNAFYIMTTEKVFELCTSNAEEKTKWQNAIWKQVGECTKNKLRTLRTVEAEVNRKSVGKRAPVLVRFGDVSMCMVCACEFTTIRRKHHCKGCGIVMCAKCSAHTAKLAYDKAKPLRICDGCFIVLFDQEDSKYSGGGAMAVGRQQSRTQGSAVHKGYLQFSGDGGRSWKKRWLVLNDNNSLYLFKAPQDLNPALTIHMDGTNTEKVELGPRKKRVVKLETERKVYLLHEQDEKVLEKWFELLAAVSVDDTTSVTSS